MDNCLYPSSSTLPTYVMGKHNHLTCIQLIFCIDGNEVGRRQLPIEILAKYPQWCVSLMLQDLPTTTDIISIDSKIISLITFDTVTQYLNWDNFWPLPLQTLHLLCQQGIITSIACTGLATIKDPKELILACRAAEFELDPNIKSIDCDYHSYTHLWRYLQYNKSIASYQVIEEPLARGDGTIIIFIDTVPMAVIKRTFYKTLLLVLFEGTVKKRFEALEQFTTHPELGTGVVIDLQYLQPSHISIDSFITETKQSIVGKHVPYYPFKLRDDLLVWRDIDIFMANNAMIDREQESCRPRAWERTPMPDYPTSIKFIPTDMPIHVTNIPISITDLNFVIPRKNAFKVEHKHGIIKVYCGYIKL